MIVKRILLNFILLKACICEEGGNENKKKKLIQNLQDEWHVSTLKSTEFYQTNICDDKIVTRYEKQKDAALIEFVSSDPLPFNESDLIQNMCIKENQDLIPKKHIDKDNNETQLPKNTLSKSDNKLKIDIPTIDIDNATNITQSTIRKNVTKESRRANDYQFSSIEYYDEHPDFDESTCPDDVEVVVLELDELRSYDLQCELMIEWRSLD